MTTAQDQQSRADFEAWWKEFSWCGLDGGGGYEKTSAYAAWKFQADRAAAEVQAMCRVPTNVPSAGLDHAAIQSAAFSTSFDDDCPLFAAVKLRDAAIAISDLLGLLAAVQRQPAAQERKPLTDE